MKLSGWLYMVVGVAMILYVKFIEAKRDTNLGVFFWIGVAFILWGFAKEIFTRVRRKKQTSEPVGPPPKKHHDHDQRHPGGNRYHGRSSHETHQHVKGEKHPSHPHHPAHKKCPRCHVPNSSRANFCHGCGHKF